MLLSLRKSSLTSLFKELRVFKGFKHRTQWVFRGSLSSGEHAQWVPFSLSFVCQSELFFCLQWSSVSSLLRNSTLETVFRPFPTKMDRNQALWGGTAGGFVGMGGVGVVREKTISTQESTTVFFVWWLEPWEAATLIFKIWSCTIRSDLKISTTSAENALF